MRKWFFMCWAPEFPADEGIWYALDGSAIPENP